VRLSARGSHSSQGPPELVFQDGEVSATPPSAPRRLLGQHRVLIVEEKEPPSPSCFEFFSCLSLLRDPFF